jgi:hypothetical protein
LEKAAAAHEAAVNIDPDTLMLDAHPRFLSGEERTQHVDVELAMEFFLHDLFEWWLNTPALFTSTSSASKAFWVSKELSQAKEPAFLYKSNARLSEVFRGRT